MRLQDCGACYDKKFDAKLPPAGWRVDHGYARRIWRDPETGKLKTAFMHRMIWELEYGSPVPPVLDHINGNRLDNRLENLRAATPRLNAANVTVELKGYWKAGDGKRFQASITHDGKDYYLGQFATPEEAKEIYQKNFQIRLEHEASGLPGPPPFDLSQVRKRGRPRKQPSKLIAEFLALLDQ